MRSEVDGLNSKISLRFEEVSKEMKEQEKNSDFKLVNMKEKVETNLG